MPKMDVLFDFCYLKKKKNKKYAYFTSFPFLTSRPYKEQIAVYHNAPYHAFYLLMLVWRNYIFTIQISNMPHRTVSVL